MNVKLAFILDCERPVIAGEETFYVNARPVYIEDGRLRNLAESSSLRWEDKDAPDFHVRQARGLRDMVVGGISTVQNPDEIIGWKYSIRGAYSLDLSALRWAVKSMQAIDRKLKKREEEFGRADTFTAWLLRVASALKVAEFRVKVTCNGASYDENEYETLATAGDVIGHIERAHYQFQTSCKHKVAS